MFRLPVVAIAIANCKGRTDNIDAFVMARFTAYLNFQSLMARYLILIPLAWLSGVGAYLSALAIIWGQSIGGDLAAVLFWSFFAFLVAFPVAYLPILIVIRRFLGGYQPVLVFPMVAALIGVVPTAIIVMRFGGGIRGLFSPEASLFLIAFAVMGIVVGFGFAWDRPKWETQ